MQDARDNVVKATQELNQALKDSIQQFRKASEEAINANEIKIAEFKVKIAKEKKEFKAKDERRLAELEEQNNNMKKELEEFKEDQRENWNSFRLKFKHNMDEFGEAMRDFWVGRR